MQPSKVLGDVASGVSLRMLQERVPRRGGSAVPVVPQDRAAFQPQGHHAVLARLWRARRPAHRRGGRGASGSLARGWGSRQVGGPVPGRAPAASELGIPRMQPPLLPGDVEIAPPVKGKQEGLAAIGFKVVDRDAVAVVEVDGGRGLPQDRFDRGFVCPCWYGLAYVL